MKTRIRLVNVEVGKVFAHAPIVRGFKDDQGKTDFEYGPEKWYVHFIGSSESLCLGPGKPDLKTGDLVDILIIPKDPTCGS